MRIQAGVIRGDATMLEVDGQQIAAYQGESVAAALLAGGYRRFRSSAVNGASRGPFCLIGVCQECIVTIDGRRVEACLEPVRTGMVVALDP